MASQKRPDILSRKSSQRLPPPSLFQGPPSRNASNLSLQPGLLPKGSPSSQGQPPLLRQHSARSNLTDVPVPGSPFTRPSRARGQSEVEAADALWEEMQNTLAEVELSALNGDHVFGTEHSKALDELRTKQLALAQAWVRSEADEVVDHPSSDDPPSGTKGGVAESVRRESVGGEEGGQNLLDEKTEKDILLARKRREANDRYFDRVNSGVLDVVAKLEEVALAMKDVEQESKEIWSENESVDGPVESNT